MSALVMSASPYAETRFLNIRETRLCASNDKNMTFVLELNYILESYVRYNDATEQS